MRVLVIEDEPAIMGLLVTLLQQERFEVDVARNGRVGYEKIQTQRYNLIVLDIRLPGKSGYDIIPAIRAMGRKTPILVVSGCSSPSEKVLGLNMGADDYIGKPFDPAEFVARVKVLLRRSMRSRKNVIKLRDVLVNLDTMSISRAGKPIPLSKKEFGIFLELARSPDKVVQRHVLAVAVWGDQKTPVASNTLDVHMRTLRLKVEKEFPTLEPLIETVRGFGYMIRSRLPETPKAGKKKKGAKKVDTHPKSK